MALEKLSALMPQMGSSILVAALKETAFEVEPAVNMLRSFSTDQEESLKALHKVSTWYESIYIMILTKYQQPSLDIPDS